MTRAMTWKEVIGALADAEMELRTIGSNIRLPGPVRLQALKRANRLLPMLPPEVQPRPSAGNPPRRSWLILNGAPTHPIPAARNVILGRWDRPRQVPFAR